MSILLWGRNSRRKNILVCGGFETKMMYWYHGMGRVSGFIRPCYKCGSGGLCANAIHCGVILFCLFAVMVVVG